MLDIKTIDFHLLRRTYVAFIAHPIAFSLQIVFKTYYKNCLFFNWLLYKCLHKIL